MKKQMIHLIGVLNLMAMYLFEIIQALPAVIGTKAKRRLHCVDRGKNGVKLLTSKNLKKSSINKGKKQRLVY